MDVLARKNSFTVVLLVIIMIMGVEIVYLIYQNRRLGAMLTEASSIRTLQQGQVVPPLVVKDLGGLPVEMRYGAREPSTVLIWFSPSCHVCSENAAFWNDVYDRYRTNKVRFLVFCDGEVDEARAYVAQHSLMFPVISVTDDSLLEAYNGRVMPQTALISPQGKVERVWPGALEKSRQNEITAVLDSLTKQPL